jgi:CelD/BcsL family acetyltransferase involved in cellulose biosynthesis
MDAELRIASVRPADLTAEERAAWAAFRAVRPELASPYFDLRYVLAAGEVAPHAAVAVVRRAGRIEAFLPFQRRAGLVQPLGAPLSDYHGLVAAPGASVSLASVLKAIGGRSLRFGGLVGPAPEGAAVRARSAMAARLDGGFEAYLERRRALGHGGELKDKRRRARALARDHGPVAFTFGRDPGDGLDLVVRLKRAQWRRTAQHDVLASRWTRALLERLSAGEAPDFGARFAILRAGGRVVAAEIGLISADAYHLWFPVYDPDFARYSPGALMTLETLKAAAEQGIRTVDFGPMDEGYKRVFADPAMTVWDGQVHTRGFMADCWRMVEQLSAPAPALDGSWRSGLRRLDRIKACEPTFGGQVGAALRNLARLGRRHRRKIAWITLAAALPLGALAFD